MCYDTLASSETVPTAPEDVLDGATVGPGQVAYCTGCLSELRSGQDVTAYAYRLAHARTWDIARLYCRACAPTRIRGPTLGACEVLCTCTLGTQSRPDTQVHRLCLIEPTETAYSAPDEGLTP